MLEQTKNLSFIFNISSFKRLSINQMQMELTLLFLYKIVIIFHIIFTTDSTNDISS